MNWSLFFRAVLLVVLFQTTWFISQDGKEVTSEQSNAESEKDAQSESVLQTFDELRAETIQAPHRIEIPADQLVIEIPDSEKASMRKWRPGDRGLPHLVPSWLPDHLQLEKKEHFESVIRSFYSNGQDAKLWLIQSKDTEVMKEDIAVCEALETESEHQVVRNGEKDGYQFVVCDQGLLEQDITAFIDSLFVLPVSPGQEQYFELLDDGQQLDHYRPEQREFHVYPVAAWNEWVDEQKESPRLKLQDASNRIVIALFAGKKGSGGYTITAESIHQIDQTLVVTIHETSPDGVAATVITHPYEIIYVTPDFTANQVQIRSTQGEALASFTKF